MEKTIETETDIRLKGGVQQIYLAPGKFICREVSHDWDSEEFTEKVLADNWVVAMVGFGCASVIGAQPTGTAEDSKTDEDDNRGEWEGFYDGFVEEWCPEDW